MKLLQLENVSYQIGTKKLLDNISADINTGEVVVIMGANGAGKTTLIRSISNEIQCLGNVIFKGKSISHWKYIEKAPHIGYFSQQNAINIPLPVEEVVLMGRYPYFGNQPTKNDLEISHRNIQKTDMEALKEQFYDNLSGGEKQRTHLARVLSQLDNNDIDHKMLLLDEPFNNLDVYHQYKIMKQVKDFVKKENTAIVVLHDLNIAAQFADKILLLKNGVLLDKGSPTEIFTEKNIQNAYDYPCKIIENPITKSLMVIFGEEHNN